MQTRYQLFPGVQLSIIGLASRLMIVLELGPLLTGLVLTGRVGGRMTAEIGTMRVTEQIDALETLAYDPVAFLIVPRLLAAIADAADARRPRRRHRPVQRLRRFGSFHRRHGLATSSPVCGSASERSRSSTACSRRRMFGAAIALICAYEGYITEAGAEGVGRSTARAVVITSVTILVLDALTAGVLAPFLQT